MTTSISVMTGAFDATGKVFTWRHEDYDPVFGKKIKMRDVVRFTGPDNSVMEFYKTLPDGKEQKTGEIKLTRKK